ARMLQRRVRLVDVRVSRLATAILRVSAGSRMMPGMMMALLDRLTLIEPGFRIIHFFLFIPAGEVSRPVLRIFVILAQNGRRVRVAHDVLAEVAVVLEHVMDQGAKEDDVAARPQWSPDVRHSRGPRKPRINV